MDIKYKIKNLPALPGVYLMKDSLNQVIYVGKSKRLKNRVSSYFINSKNRSSKIMKLVKNIKDFDYIITDTEFEAFLLECKLIKQINPAYNSQMKSDKRYLYIRINTEASKENISIALDFEEDGSFYFGPFTSKSAVENALEGIKLSCRISCNGKPSKKTSTCLNYSLGLCIGICKGEERKELYRSILNKVVNLLQGKDKSILEDLKQKMLTASEAYDFDEAARCRDYIASINALIKKSKVVSFTKKNKNILLLEPLEDNSMKLFFIKGSSLLSHIKLFTSEKNTEALEAEIKAEVLRCFKEPKALKAEEIGKEVIDQSQIIYSYIKNSKNCRHSVIAEKWLKPSEDKKLEDAIRKLLYGFY